MEQLRENRKARYLTNRQKQILELLATGKLNKEIASQLFITESTVKGHLQCISEKLGARNRMEILVKAQQLKIIKLAAMT